MNVFFSGDIPAAVENEIYSYGTHVLVPKMEPSHYLSLQNLLPQKLYFLEAYLVKTCPFRPFPEAKFMKVQFR
jgi:hypothetical protein